MDKIQDAIAKARAARNLPAGSVPIPAQAGEAVAPPPSPQSAGPAAEAGVPAAPVVPAAPAPVDALPHRPVQPKATAPAPASADVKAAWEALPLFTPSASRLRRNRIMTVDGGRNATDFDVLRTRILQQARANGWRRVAITSPGPGCGKSTLVLNLAFSLARQRDQRTFVAEMDMRRPSLARALGLKQRLSFADTLKGDSPFEDNALRLDSNLMVATNAAPVPRAAELLQSASAAQALNDITDRYDPTIALFDMPPLLAGDDTMAFLSQVDCVILLAAAEQSTIKQIDACERDIASQTNVMGVVLNKCRYIDRDNSYAYYE